MKNLLLGGLAGLVLSACGPEPVKPGTEPTPTYNAPVVQLSVDQAQTGMSPAADYAQGTNLNAVAQATDSDDDLSSLKLYVDGSEVASGVDSATTSIDTSSLSLDRHVVLAVAKDAQGLESEKEVAFTLEEDGTVVDTNQAPVANFTYSPSNPKEGQNVTFTSTSTDADGDSLNCTYIIDGQTKNGCQVTHTYNSEMTDNVTLSVNDGELSDVINKDVTVESQFVGNAPQLDLWDVVKSYSEGVNALTIQLNSSDSDGSINSTTIIDHNVEGAGPQINLANQVVTAYDLTTTNPTAHVTVQICDNDSNCIEEQLDFEIGRTNYEMRLTLDNGTTVTDVSIPESYAKNICDNIPACDLSTNGVSSIDRDAAGDLTATKALLTNIQSNTLIPHYNGDDQTATDLINYVKTIVDDSGSNNGAGIDLDLIQLRKGQ